ncbi:MAG: hypothetical protein HY913_09130 [Desulfomonile tiedjei]|nr:hypothetical protein [Desulfomonile tiedjei]
MAEFKSLSPAVEVAGEVLMAFLAAFPQEFRSSGLRILEQHGLSDPKPNQFYALQNFLDAMKQISQSFSTQMLFRIGEQIALHAALPPGIDDLQKCLASIDVAYHMNHRGGEIGRYDYKLLGTEVGLGKATMTCPNPYPCSFDRGVIEGFAKRFKLPGSYDVLVRHDDSQPCRGKGDESCTYIVTWL